MPWPTGPLSHYVLFSHSQRYKGGRQFTAASCKSPSYHSQGRKFQLPRLSAGICSTCPAAVPTHCPSRTKPFQLLSCSTQAQPGAEGSAARVRGTCPRSTWQHLRMAWWETGSALCAAEDSAPSVSSLLNGWGDTIWEIILTRGGLLLL